MLLAIQVISKIPGMPLLPGQTIRFKDGYFSVDYKPWWPLDENYRLINDIAEELAAGTATPEAAKTFQMIEEEQLNPEDMDIIALSDHCTDLYERYFQAPKKDKPALMTAYNEAATVLNRKRNFYAAVILTDKTKDTNNNRVKREQPIPQPEASKKENIVNSIIEFYRQGKTPKEIIALGYNKNTVGCQIAKYKKTLS